MWQKCVNRKIKKERTARTKGEAPSQKEKGIMQETMEQNDSETKNKNAPSAKRRAEVIATRRKTAIMHLVGPGMDLKGKSYVTLKNYITKTCAKIQNGSRPFIR